jgi:FAD/FMN-containing dehydrogenase
VLAAGREMLEACVAAGGTISGEHGIGLEKREFMDLVFSEDDLALQRAVRDALNPRALANPGKVFPDANVPVSA